MANSLESIFILRHGEDEMADYGEGILSEKGKEKTVELATRISENDLDSKKGVVLTSNCLRAIHTAITIAEKLGCGVKTETSLTYKKENKAKIVEVISSFKEKIDFMVIVGHMGLAETLPLALIEERDKNIFLGYSEGVTVDLSTKTITKI